jgi:hypothetical protein
LRTLPEQLFNDYRGYALRKPSHCQTFDINWQFVTTIRQAIVWMNSNAWISGADGD